MWPWSIATPGHCTRRAWRTRGNWATGRPGSGGWGAWGVGREGADRAGIADSLEALAVVVAALGGSARAVRIWGAAERLRKEIGSPLLERPRHVRRVAAARAALGDDAAFDRAWKEGSALTLEQAIDLALEKTVD